MALNNIPIAEIGRRINDEIERALIRGNVETERNEAIVNARKAVIEKERLELEKLYPQYFFEPKVITRRFADTEEYQAMVRQWAREYIDKVVIDGTK